MTALPLTLRRRMFSLQVCLAKLLGWELQRLRRGSLRGHKGDFSSQDNGMASLKRRQAELKDKKRELRLEQPYFTGIFKRENFKFYKEKLTFSKNCFDFLTQGIIAATQLLLVFS